MYLGDVGVKADEHHIPPAFRGAGAACSSALPAVRIRTADNNSGACEASDVNFKV